MRNLVASGVRRVPVAFWRGWPRWLGKLELFRAVNHSLFTKPQDFKCETAFGAQFSGNTRDVIQRHIFMFGVWEPEISAWVSSFIRPGDLVVDVGANVGYFSLLAASCAVDVEVLSFEPVPSIYDAFVQNLALNPKLRIEAYALAISDHSGRTHVYRASDDNIGNSSTTNEVGSIDEGFAEMATLDEVIEMRNGGRAVRLLKIDTEGDEAAVLKGAQRTLSKMPPGSAVLVELTPEKLGARGRSAGELWDAFPMEHWEAFRIVNDYTLKSYVALDPAPLKRLSAPIDSRADLIFVRR